jgi:serine/threonine protein kinase
MLECMLDRLSLTEIEAREVIAPLVDSVIYCHKMGTLHRDIKLENIVMTTKDLNTSIFKLTDFGLSTFADRTSGFLS